MNNNPHFLGAFSSMADVWSKYPSGGTPMDYVSVNGETLYWDEDKRVWGKEFIPDDDDVEATVKGDLVVEGDISVGGVIRIGTLVIDKDFASLGKEECEEIIKNYAYSKSYVEDEFSKVNASISNIDLNKISKAECEALIKKLSYQKEEIDTKVNTINNSINEVKVDVESLDISKLDEAGCLAIIKQYTYSKEEIDSINPDGQMEGYTKVESDARYFTGINIKETDYTFNS